MARRKRSNGVGKSPACHTVGDRDRMVNQEKIGGYLVKTTLDYAKFYLSKGLSVIPIEPKGKRPAIDSWSPYQKQIPSLKEVEMWWSENPEANIAIVTGKVSGIAVVDLDSEKATVFAKGNRFPVTPTVKTGKGYHLYYAHREGVGNFQRRADLPDIDLRGEGGYVVAPPSVHETGRRYEWVGGKDLDDLPLAALPEIVLAKNTGDKIPLAELYQGVSEGQRNEALARIIGSMVSDGLSYQECLSFAHSWNKQNTPPLPDREVVTTVLSIYNKHQRESTAAVAAPQPEADILSCVKNIDALKSTTKDTDWLVYNLFPRKSVSIIAGAMKEGKTWIALEVATAIACGRDVFGFYPANKGKVLFIEGDMPNESIQWRLHNANYEFE
jgi:Bifunctional DNA primase/polymerase, N-terminal/AAA domain/Primase C terminal 1 (PriCT-1)